MFRIDIVRDYDFIKKFIAGDAELIDRLSDDYTNIDRWLPENFMWLGYFDGDTCKGLLQVGKETETVLNVHINIPLKYRGADSFLIGNSLLMHMEKICSQRFIKINAKIPEIYSDVKRFAEKNGFEVEGIDKNSYVKNGMIYNKYILGKRIER